MLFVKHEETCQVEFFISKCKYCGKHFIKFHHKQLYCSDECREHVIQNQKAEYDRLKRRNINIPTISKCKYCGGLYVKMGHRQKYCSDKCNMLAVQDQKAAYQRRRRKLINNGVLLSNETMYVGTGFLSAHRNMNFGVEYRNIRKELKRVGVG